MGVNSSLRAFL